MRSERVRAILGVWAPMAFGLFIIATAINFYFYTDLLPGLRVPDVGSWRLVCSSGVVFIGAVMILSTYGRLRKTRAARSTPSDGPPRTPSR
jgi:hypothetical protein